MIKGASGFFMAVVITVAILLCLPVPGSAAVYRAYEYFEGLPADYIAAGWQGYNFRETTPNITVTPPRHTLGTGDITIGSTTYTCVGWKDGIGISPPSGSDNSVTFAIDADVSITWIYRPARSLTIKAEPLEQQFNELWGGGRNDNGQLGDKSFTDRFTLVRTNTDPRNDFTTLSGVYAHSAALRPDGSLWTWGWNGYGQLGDNSTTSKATPTLIAADKQFTAVAAGTRHTVAIRTDGSLWAWGDNSVGALGNGTLIGSSIPLQVGTGYDWRAVTAGFHYTMAIKRDGTLWAWGENDDGRLGYPISGGNVNQANPGRVGSATDKWTLAVAGYSRSAGIKEDGSLWLWGWNGYAQTGDGTTTQRDTPVQIMAGSPWRTVAIGLAHTLAVKTDGTLWAWGNQDSGRLGNGVNSSANRTTPVQIGTATDWRTVTAGDRGSMALKADGSLWVWGRGPWGPAGSAAEVTLLTPTRYGNDTNWLMALLNTYKDGQNEKVLALRTVSHAAFADMNTLYGGGRNDNGQLGDTTATDRYSLGWLQTGSPNDFVSVSGMYAHSAALRADGSLWTWGWNGHGQLGDGTGTSKYVPIPVAADKKFTAAAAGSHHTVAIRTDGSLWAWGLNSAGELGNGTITGSNVPLQVGTGYDWRAVTAGYVHTMAIKRDGSLWAWGENDNGRLGYPISGGNVNQVNPGRVGSATDKWTLAIAGYLRSAGIKEDGTLWLWGNNGYAEIGDGTTTQRDTPVQIMVGSTWRTVAIGPSHTLAIRSDGTLWAWGNQGSGRLGNGVDNIGVNKTTPVQIGSDTDWREVTAGERAGMAIKADGSLWVWGKGPWGGPGSAAEVTYTAPTRYGTDTDWLMVLLNIFKDGDNEKVLAIRAPNRVEATPHLGTRILPGGEQVMVTAKAVPTNGGTPYFLSGYKNASGSISPAAGTAYQLPLTLNADSSVTWINQPPPATVARVTVGFIDGVPEELKNSKGFFPSPGATNLGTGAVSLSAPAEVRLADGAVWELYGWTGSGDLPSSGTSATVSFTLAQSAAIIWKYRPVPANGVAFSFSVQSSGAVTDAEAAFALYQQSSSSGSWDTVNLGGKQVKIFSQNISVKLTALAKVEKNGKTYYCTGISVNSSNYTSPVTASEAGDRKEFVVTLTNPAVASATAWSLDVDVTYAEAVKVPLGQAVPLPAGCFGATVAPLSRVNLVMPANAADTLEKDFFVAGSSLYPVRPINLFTVTCDNSDTKNFFADWGSIDLDNVVAGVPINLQPAGSAYRPEAIHYSESFAYEQWDLGDRSAFQPPRAGKTLLRFSRAGVTTPTFVTMQAVAFVLPSTASACTIGAAITPAPGGHSDPENKNGYVYYEKAFYDGAGADRAYDRQSRSGDIIAVNTNVSGSTDQEMVVVWYGRGSSEPSASIGWPLSTKLTRYTCAWPVNPKGVIIAQGTGALLTAHEKTGSIYNQPDSALPGYNPNEEHALLQGGVLYVLRTDLNNAATSSAAYVLLKYRDTGTGKWAMTPYRVYAELGAYTFTYGATAGQLIQPPGALNLFPPTDSSRHKAADTAGNAWYFRDHNGGHWAKASNGLTGTSQSKIVMQWYYPLQAGFYYPFTDASGNPLKIGEPIPFQNGGARHTDPPRDVVYSIAWPATAPVLAVGETLTTAKNGLPAVANMAAVQLIFDSGGTGSIGTLFSPYAERANTVTLATLPTDLKTEARDGKTYFIDLPFALRSRLVYDPTARVLKLKGISLDTGTGEPLLLANIMSLREKARIAGLSPNPVWQANVAALYTATATPADLGLPLALSAGFAQKSGYLVLAENDDASLGSTPVALHIIKVEAGPYQGEIKVIKPDNPFDEKLTLRHSGDFAGQADKIYFAWYYQPDNSGIPPLLGTAAVPSGWVPFATGKGLNDITIEGAGKLTLEDNWFMVRYYYGDDPATAALDPIYPSLVNSQPILPAGTRDINAITNNWSRWAGAPGGTTAQLAEGWIKRVVSDLNPLDARVKDFRNNATNTTVSMLSQLGERYSGAIALNGSAANLNSLGLISAYQTVLDRGESFSINSSPPVDSAATNNALLNAATRIADFYTLLGNEAYIDSQDPTVGYDSRSGQTGTMASSLFAFQNQAGSLLEEELALLSGRDSSTSTTRSAPFYNRFIWNFTNGDGELAYVQTYNVNDGNKDGFINEADARSMYPQGHGDAWGHYLTAMTTWYGLLRNGNYSWQPRVESVLVGSSPVPVDYLDERKFARAAAYKAHTGAEIVDLTYRKLYVDDPSGQWQGYKDAVTVIQNGTPQKRAWGVDDWARRAGQGAYFDWVAANALLPAADTVNTGIQKIDRTTVPELAEVASNFEMVQFKADQADAGYNPLGLARGVVPFDIDPTLVMAGFGREPQSHFEQIYGRAVKALENARTVYDYASQYRELLRGNEDSLDSFSVQTTKQEQSYLNQLIELFGYPYSGDIGPGKTYEAGYEGPDIFHYNYVNVPQLIGMDTLDVKTVNFAFTIPELTPSADDLSIGYRPMNLSYQLTPGLPWPFSTPPAGWGERQAPGEIQMALTELIKANTVYQKGLQTFSAGLEDMELAVKTLEARFNVKRDQIKIMDDSNKIIADYSLLATGLRSLQAGLNALSKYLLNKATASMDALPKIIGLSNDPSFPARTVIMTASTWYTTTLDVFAVAAGVGAGAAESTIVKEMKSQERKLVVSDATAEVKGLVAGVERSANALAPMVQDLYAQAAGIQQALDRYHAVLARGGRILAERETFRKRTAGEIQDYRYQDLSFRTFRNDAVQKYRATFDLAARYSYLAASAYDYETNLLRSDKASGSNFLTEITKQRSPGTITNEVPMVGKAGLADPLARLNQNFSVYKTQLGFNNPQTETNPFSLRTGLFRIKADASSNVNWQNELRRYLVADLNAYESFNRYCRPFTDNTTIPQAGLVIPFTSEIRFGKNFFGYPLGNGDSSFDPSKFATRIRSVGLWFTGYDKAGLASTPRAYLVPVGADVLRSPAGNSFEERHWQIADQKLPVPFPISVDELDSDTYIPINDTLTEQYGGIRKFSSIRAYNDSGLSGTSAESLTQLNTDSSLIGRSVWNTQWLLIIPGGFLLDDPANGLNNFITNVSDIRLLFQTYSYSGN